MDEIQISQRKQLIDIHVAAGCGQKDEVYRLIRQQVDVNLQDVKGQTALDCACNHAHFRTAKLLIEAGADVNLIDSRGWSPLHFALARKENFERISDRFWKIVVLLLDSGADPYKRTLSGKSIFDRVKDDEQRLQIRLIHCKNKIKSCTDRESRASMIDKYLRVKDFFELVKRGDNDIEDVSLFITPRLVRSRLESSDNITPLHRAAGYNHTKTAKLLIENGADISAMDDHRQVPLHNAACYGHVEMIELLIREGCCIDTQDVDGLSPMHVAATSKNIVACHTLVNLGADKMLRARDGRLPKDFAATEAVKQILNIDDISKTLTTSSQSHFEQAVYVQVMKGHIDGASDMTQNCPPNIKPTDQSLMLDSKSDERLFKNPIASQKLITLMNYEPKFKLIEERMNSSIRPHDGQVYSSYEIISIQQNLNQNLWLDYRGFCQHLMRWSDLPSNERLLFHGSKSIDEIQAKGFDRRYARGDGMFGAGIYFASESSKSNQYTFGFGQGCSLHADKSCYVCVRKLILAQVNLGRSLISDEEIPDLVCAPPRYDSVSGEPGITRGLKYSEYVIYNSAQAYPLYLITYRIKP